MKKLSNSYMTKNSQKRNACQAKNLREKLYETLLEEHNLEADQLRNSVLLLQRRPMMSPPPESDVPLERGAGADPVDVDGSVGGSVDGESDLMNWSEGERSSRAIVNWEELLELKGIENWVVVSNIFYFHPYLGKIPILTNIFQRG